MSTSPRQPSAARRKLAREDEAPVSPLDVLRLLGGGVLLSCLLSYFVTETSLVWNLRAPTWSSPWHVVRAWMRGPISLTPAELSLYNGTDVSLPIYLAINGTIYDVSASPSFYGPGGGYHFFAGNDGTRAFVTGCFSEDVTPDLRGVEDMFLPVDDDDGDGDGDGADKRRDEDGRLSKADRKIRREQVE